MNEIEIDLSKYIDNFKIDKDKAKQYGGYKKIANDLSKENMKLAFENTILQAKIGKAIEYIEKSMNNPQPWHEYLFGDEDGKVENLDKLLDILKEDK